MAAAPDRRADNRRLEDRLLQRMAVDSAEVLSVVERGGAISYITPSSERLFGWPPGELQGGAAEKLFHPDDLRQLGTRPRGGERRSAARVRCRHRDGSWHTVEARVRPIASAPGVNPVGVVVFSRDVTEESATHQRLRQRDARLAEVEAQLSQLQAERAELLGRAGSAPVGADRLKAEFLQTVSHELRTPLTAILGFSDLLSTEPGLAERSELEIIRRNGRRLMDIIEDMLTIARAEAGDLDLAPSPTDLVATVNRVIEPYRHQAQQRGLSLETEMPGRAIAMVDELALVSGLRHLLANAVKFTTEGSILVRVSEVHGMVRVAVEDSGPGVPVSAREIIFKDFTQADQSTTRRHGGLGIGLSLVRRLVVLQDGRFGLQDRPGGGTIFWLSFPAAS